MPPAPMRSFSVSDSPSAISQLARFACFAATGMMPAGMAEAQQTPDLEYRPPIEHSAFEQGGGPLVAIDEAHGNFHTIDGRYGPFAELLKRDGFRVEGFKDAFSKDRLKKVRVLVIANALHPSNQGNWTLPTPSAFTPDEIESVSGWVKDGGTLLLIADHMPFPGAAGKLAEAFGAEFSNGYARTGSTGQRGDVFKIGDGLIEGPITKGRPDDKPVTTVATFGGSAFRLPAGANPILLFGKGSISRETTKAPGITPGAPEIAVEGWSQGAAMDHGKGRVAIFGEASMFSAQRSGPAKRPMGMNDPIAAENHQFVLNLIRWLAADQPVPCSH